jgi:hypothetical protein
MAQEQIYRVEYFDIGEDPRDLEARLNDMAYVGWLVHSMVTYTSWSESLGRELHRFTVIFVRASEQTV